MIASRAIFQPTARTTESREGRNALRADDRAAAGAVLGGAARDRPACGGRGVRVLLPVRPLPELPGPGGQSDDRRLGRPRRAGPGDVADRARNARVAGDL